MPLNEVEAFIDYTKQSDYEPFKSIIISGGEPLLWDNLEDGVRILAASGLSEKLNIFSNGLNTKAVTPELLGNITTLRLSKYAGNSDILSDLVDRFGTEHINVVDRTKHTPIPAAPLEGVLPAKCGCEGYALCDGVMYACPMVPAVAKEMKWSISDMIETYQPLWPHWAEALAGFGRGNHVLCQACIGNHRVRARMAEQENLARVETVRVQAKLNLFEFKRAMDRANIPFYLVAGTLLGAYREGDFIDGDEDDIDVAVTAEDFARIDDAHQSLLDAEFERIKVFKVKDKVESVTYKRGSNHIDVACMNIRDGKAFCYGRSSRRHGLPPIFAYVFPARCFEYFNLLEFQGVRCRIPAHTEDYLSAKYIDWKTPTDRQHYDYLDVRQSPCVDGSGWWDNGHSE